MFSKSNPATACGMWSLTYIIALAIVIMLILIGLAFSKHLNKRGVRIAILVAGIFTILTEIIKMIWTGIVNGISSIEFVPLYFCSLFMYACVLALFKNETIKNTGVAFMFFGGIVGATAFFIYPSANIPSYPIYHFMCLRTMIYHGLMIYIGVLIVITGFYKPKAKHFLNYFVFVGLACIGAYIMNVTTGSDLMYISRPIPIKISQIVFNAAPKLYPFIGMLVQIFCPFWGVYFIYTLLNIVLEKKKIKRLEFLAEKEFKS